MPNIPPMLFLGKNLTEYAEQITDLGGFCITPETVHYTI